LETPIRQANDCINAGASRTGVTNLFAVAGHFVSYRRVSGPHNFLVIESGYQLQGSHKCKIPRTVPKNL